LLNKDAYEFKMRVTIAASGQGRFAEELSFAEDCHLSGYRPILLVLDPTPSSRLNELSEKYREYGGKAYVGDDAWAHLENKAGEVMSRFLRQYVRGTISRIDEAHSRLLPISLKYEPNDNTIQVVIGEHRIKLR